MMKSIFFFALLFSGYSFAQQSFDKLFPVQWKTKIGVTTYRTNMVFQDGSIFIGSNGLDRNFRIDSLDGVVRLNAKTGKITKRYSPPIAGDNDITGIAIDANKLYCGSDNYTFYCYDISTGLELWKYPLPYDVESTPVLADFNGDGKKDVFFSVEQYGFYALNGVDGSVLWNNDSISSHNGNTAALSYDVNGDGVLDLITGVRGGPNTLELAGYKMAHYGDYHAAINGKTGEFLWIKETGAGINSSPFMTMVDGKVCFAFIDTYGEFQIISAKGDLIFKTNFGNDHHEMPVISSKNILYLGAYSVNISPKYWEQVEAVELADEEVEVETKHDSYSQFSETMDVPSNSSFNDYERYTSSVVLADVLGNGTIQALVASEDGTLIIRDETGKITHTFKLPKGVEATLFIKDIDGDGKLEILVADLDGYLTCYSTKSKGKVELGSYR